MKKLIALLLFSLAFQVSRSQVMYPYTFSKTTATYSDLVGATNLTAGNVWDDTIMAIPLGFNFKWALANRTIDSIMIDTYGILYATEDFDPNAEFGNRIMMPYQTDLCDRSTNTGGTTPVSPVSYQTTGTPGNRICKIEFKNAGFYEDNSGNDAVNFQVWLYETSNEIEFRYGPQSVADIATCFLGQAGPWINLAYKSSLDLVNFKLTVDSCTYVSGNTTTAAAVNSTTTIDLDNPPSTFAFVGLPANGQVFKWTPPGTSTSIHDINGTFAAVEVYPTQIEDRVFVQHTGNMEWAVLYDHQGKRIQKFDVSATRNQLDMSFLASGFYTLTLHSTSGLSKSYKLIK